MTVTKTIYPLTTYSAENIAFSVLGDVYSAGYLADLALQR